MGVDEMFFHKIILLIALGVLTSCSSKTNTAEDNFFAEEGEKISESAEDFWGEKQFSSSGPDEENFFRENAQDTFDSENKDDHFSNQNKEGNFFNQHKEDNFFTGQVVGEEPIEADSYEKKRVQFFGRKKAPASKPFRKKSASTTAPVNPKIVEYSNYTIKPGDTLMLISWSIHGDYRKWKDILKDNPHRARKLIPGTTLLIKHNKSSMFSPPKGLAYIIQRNDTLGSISQDKYGTFRKWKKIYHNNRSLIRDPDLIFTGFTIFYEPIKSLTNTGPQNERTNSFGI